MFDRVEGPAILLGNSVDTDRIIPARGCDTAEASRLAEWLFLDHDPGLRERLPGSILVAGRNFGCGSSRETAPLALRTAGVQGVVARSVARIFFRNAINLGLPILECPELADRVREGETVRLDLRTGGVELPEREIRIPAHPLPDLLRSVLQAGGLASWLRGSTGDIP